MRLLIVATLRGRAHDDPAQVAPARERMELLTAALAPYDAGRYLASAAA